MNRHHPYGGGSFDAGQPNRGGIGPDRLHRANAAGRGRGRGGPHGYDGHSEGFNGNSGSRDHSAGPSNSSYFSEPGGSHGTPNRALKANASWSSGFASSEGSFDNISNASRRPILGADTDKVQNAIIEERIGRERPCRTLFTRNIKYETNSSDVRQSFAEHGDIKTFFDLISTRGMVFVTFYDLRAAERAREHLQGTEISGRPIDVHYSLPRDDAKGDKDSHMQGFLLAVLQNSSGRLMDEHEVRRVFSPFGDIRSITSILGRPDRKHVEYFDLRACQDAYDHLNRQPFQDGVLEIDFAWDTTAESNPSQRGNRNDYDDSKGRTRGGRANRGRQRGGRGTQDDPFGRRDEWERTDRQDRRRGIDDHYTDDRRDRKFFNDRVQGDTSSGFPEDRGGNNPGDYKKGPNNNFGSANADAAAYGKFQNLQPNGPQAGQPNFAGAFANQNGSSYNSALPVYPQTSNPGVLGYPGQNPNYGPQSNAALSYGAPAAAATGPLYAQPHSQVSQYGAAPTSTTAYGQPSSIAGYGQPPVAPPASATLHRQTSQFPGNIYNQHASNAPISHQQPSSSFGQSVGHASGYAPPPVGDIPGASYGRQALHPAYPPLPMNPSEYAGSSTNSYSPGTSGLGQMSGQSSITSANPLAVEDQTRKVQELLAALKQPQSQAAIAIASQSPSKPGLEPLTAREYVTQPVNPYAFLSPSLPQSGIPAGLPPNIMALLQAGSAQYNSSGSVPPVAQEGFNQLMAYLQTQPQTRSQSQKPPGS